MRMFRATIVNVSWDTCGHSGLSKSGTVVSGVCGYEKTGVVARLAVWPRGQFVEQCRADRDSRAPIGAGCRLPRLSSAESVYFIVIFLPTYAT